MTVEKVEGGCAEVAVSAVGGGECGVGGAADGEEGFGEERAAGVELALVGFGKRGAGEIKGKEAGVVDRLGGDGAYGAGDGGALFEAASLGGERVGEGGYLVETCHEFASSRRRMQVAGGRGADCQG